MLKPLALLVDGADAAAVDVLLSWTGA